MITSGSSTSLKQQIGLAPFVAIISAAQETRVDMIPQWFAVYFHKSRNFKDSVFLQYDESDHVMRVRRLCSHPTPAVHPARSRRQPHPDLTAAAAKSRGSGKRTRCGRVMGQRWGVFIRIALISCANYICERCCFKKPRVCSRPPARGQPFTVPW